MVLTGKPLIWLSFFIKVDQMQKTVSNDDSFIQASSERRPPRRTKITDVLVRRVRSESKAFAIWDTHLKGFCLRVQPSSQKSFKVVYSRRGQPRWFHIADAKQVSLKDARKIGAEVLLRVAKGEDPVADKRAHRGATLEEIHKRYVNERASKRNKSWRQAEALIQRYILPSLGKFSVKDVTHADVSTTVGRIKAPVLYNQVLKSASAVFNWAIKQSLITSNVCKDIERNPTKSRERILSDSEVRLIMAALTSLCTPQARALQVILLTGARPGEVAHMLHEHLDGGFWLQPGQKTRDWPGTKNKLDHACPLSRPARGIIDGQRPGNVVPVAGYVFADANGKPVKDLPGVMRRICKQLSVRDAIRPHDLRRSFLSMITTLGFDRHLMNVIANHVTKETTDVYDRAKYRNRAKEAAEAAAERIMALARGQVTGVVELHRGGVQKSFEKFVQ
jgi:integrase